MDNISNFDKLIINLSSNEKKELLEKMEMTFEISQESLSADDDVIDSEFQTFQQEYDSLNFLQKVYIFLQSLIKQKDIPSVLKDHKVNLLRKKYFGDSELADFKNGLLNQTFYDELMKLKEPCRFFRTPLQKIFSYENKQDFYAFLGGIILPELQQELLAKTDPWEIEKKDMEIEVSYIKSEIDSFFELKMDSVSDLDCSIMNEACQSLYGLHLLSSFELKTITSCYNTVIPETGKVCRIEDVQEKLLELSGILRSLNKPPTIRAMESLFLYSMDNDELKESLNRQMAVADTFLSTIRDFNKKVPLENLVKVLSANLGKNSKNPPIVEDWFRNYRKFWDSRVNRMYSFFVNERKKNDFEKELCALLNVRYIKPVEKYSRNYYFEGSPALYEKSLAFVQIFMMEIYPNRLYTPLMTISREGEFYKKGNRTEFDKFLNYIGLLDKKLANILHMIHGKGYLGEKVIQAAVEKEEVKEKVIGDALEQVDYEIVSLLDGFLSHMRMLNKITHGIVIGDGGSYDTLSNISSIGGKSNNELKESFKMISVIINKIVKYINEMKILEEKKL